MLNQTVYVSATPGDYELEKTGGVVVEQVVRPTGLLDPPIEVRPSVNQIDDLLDEIDKRVKNSRPGTGDYAYQTNGGGNG